MIRTTLAAILVATPVFAEPVAYVLDSAHSQVVFTYEHLGFSTTTGMFSGFEGEIMFDAEDPAASSVEVSMPTASMITGWQPREEHFMTEDFLDAAQNEAIRFVSTGIEVTGEDTALITGDLTVNGITQEVVLDATLNQSGEHPIEGKPWLGFDATASILRSDFDAGLYAPMVSDEIEVMISIEAVQADA